MYSLGKWKMFKKQQKQHNKKLTVVGLCGKIELETTKNKCLVLL